MKVLSVVGRCSQLPTFYKFTLFGVFALILLATLQTGPVDFRQHWDKLRGPKKNNGLADGIPLRVMFIGASMTLGEHSTGERGYRKQIRDWLVAQGNEVNYVGQNRYGDFLDNDVQAFGAQPIKPTLDRCKEIVPQTQPNLILINAGSSDCFQQKHWGPAFILQKMRALVDYLFEASPRATIIMSTIIMSPWENVDDCVKSANAQIRQVANDLIREGKPVVLAEMHYDQGLPNRVEKKHIGKDNMHPIDAGYFLMGDIFIESIQDVEEKGWLRAPVNNGIPFDGEAERHAEEAKSDKQIAETKPEEQVKAEEKRADEKHNSRRRRHP
ncbi:putative carbohydrate esterase family 3 protein [Rosellinia necatrix]|uniref:Putative carbohydrate esterase family 3 protein n=1 Tax=Rosellinia necatrix TaxID=77044 RepID=A0A1W2TIS2_ROSNE|nr:putative carbohydrate esterase family 3 protein [Rosellinia necatrix]